MKDVSTQMDCNTGQSFLTRAANQRLLFKVAGIPRNDTEATLLHIFFLYTSKEVLTLLAVIALVLGGIPTAFTLLYHPKLIWMTLPIGLVPIFITFLTLGLIHLRVALAAAMGQDSKVVYVSSFAASFFAASLTIAGFFLLVEASEPGAFRELIADDPNDLVPWIFGALVYAAIAEFVTMFLLRYVLPTGSQRFTDLGYKRLQLRPLTPEGEVTIGETRCTLSSLVSVEAEGNYVRIVTADDEPLERITFANVLQMLPENTGVQVHRSRWVAFAGIERVESKGGAGLVIVTTKGNGLTVTQSRLEDVTHALRSYQVSSGRMIFRDFSK